MTAAVVLTAAVVVLVVVIHRVRNRWLRVRVVGLSMSPTFQPGDRVLARRTDLSRISAGDVVVIEGPVADAQQFAHRVAQWMSDYVVVDRDLPAITPDSGKTQRIIKRVAAVAGEPLPFPVPGYGEGSVVPVDQLAVLGDNLDQSIDSRHHGFIPATHVLGVVRPSQ